MAIIAFSGYARSGKDTAALIMQYLLSQTELPFTLNELIQPGAEEKFAPMLAEMCEWRKMSFAFNVKKVVSILTGIPLTTLMYDQSIKEQELGREWDFPIYRPNHEHPFLIPMTVREALQKVGTDALRDNFHKDVWVNSLLGKYKDTSKWVITDLRFQNEALALRQKDAVLVRISREGVVPANNHPSETDLDDFPFDYYIQNDGDVANLMLQVLQLVKKLQIL